MKIYALLIGINEYGRNPLSQCVNDTKKIESYLKGLAKEPYNHEVILNILHDKNATKTNVVKEIGDFLGQANDEDVALFYFSGHGAHEDAKGRFPDEHDGLIECLACHFDQDQASGFLLADKEIRYLFNEKIKSNPHLVTVFDCCHSGDMVRAGDEGSGEDKIKRMSGYFKAREYNEFVFHDIPEDELKSKPLAESFPYKNHIHLAACSSSQYSWEDSQGGVFTRYLLQLLKAKGNRINYQGITKWAKISLKDMTKKKQTPTYSVQGEGKMSAMSSWLNLHEGDTESLPASIKYNEAKGWYLNMGKLMGVKKGTLVSIDEIKDEEGKPITLEVDEVDIEFSLMEDPVAKDYDLSKPEYRVTINTIFSQLILFVNDLDGDPLEKKKIENILKANTNIVSDKGDADFYINIFNELVYISLPGDQFRPLARQIDILTQSDKLENLLNQQINNLLKWNHFDSLENPDNNFETPPIKVELKITGEENWHDVTNNPDFQLVARSDRYPIYDGEGKIIINELLGQEYQIKVTNVSNRKIYVGVLQLGSDMGITSDFWDEQVIELEGINKQGKEYVKYFYDHEEDNFCTILLDSYMEIYNWKKEWVHYKFIVSNYENFGTSIRSYLQPGLSNPMTLGKYDSPQLETTRSAQKSSKLKKVVKRWGTLKTTISLYNPTYNIISADLKDLWNYYMNSEHIAPFINKLYLNNRIYGLAITSTGLPNRTGEDENQKAIGGIKKNLGNYLDDHRRKRKFLKARRKMLNKPVVIAEGDSWFLYPFLVKDIIDYVIEEYPVRSLAAAGDELANYKRDGKLLKNVAEIRPKYVLISGGGNDIIGPEIQNILAGNIPPGKAPREYLNDKYDQNMAKLEELYKYFIHELKKHESVKQVFLHGYDYIRVDHNDEFVENGWVNKYMLLKGIRAADDRKRVIELLINNFNTLLMNLAKNDPFVTYLNLRGKVNKKEQWFDEIHPNDEGFGILGNIFIEAINTHQNNFD